MRRLALFAFVLSLEAGAQSLGGGASCGPGRVCTSTRFRSGDGSASLPAYSFTADPDTGLYRSGANEASIATNGAQRLLIDSAGRVSAETAAVGFAMNGTSVFYHQQEDGATGSIIRSVGTAAGIGATDANLKVFPTNVLGANDAVFSVGTQNNGTVLFIVDYEGDTTATSLSLTTPLAMASGGSAKALTASAGAAVYSDADSLEVTAVGTTGQVLRSAGAGTPTWGSGLGARTSADNVTIGAAGATYGCATAVVTVTCTVGQHVEVTPQQDDVAWDTGQLSAFCEDSNAVKIVFCGGSSADPANTNDYWIDVTTP